MSIKQELDETSIKRIKVEQHKKRQQKKLILSKS
jgi:hypothetical protein